ncbi:MAG: HPr(Ser) kinase/phosphatase [Verrucomicrobiales bacterium]|nr:HPr(Ser) kinase/phosphatase [Verrucomicrobiales bacterium]
MSKPNNKSTVVKSVEVADFFERHKEELRMKLIGKRSGFDRKIMEPTVNRPGLALAGYYNYFAHHRIQVIGKAERSFLKHLEATEKKRRFTDLCKRQIPCIIVSRGDTLSTLSVEIANKYKLSVFQTTMVTMKFINAATVRLEWEFASRTTQHGSMVDVMGIGILIRGASGTGKSETVLSLLRRGASLVSDDMVRFRNFEGREILGEAPELGQNHMEVRGLGIINVPALFGVGTIRTEKRLDLVITLRPADQMNEMDRIGLDKGYFNLLGMKLPHVELPVAAGRDIAQLVEVAALDQKLKALGHDSAVEFNKKLLKMMRERRKSVV